MKAKDYSLSVVTQQTNSAKEWLKTNKLTEDQIEEGARYLCLSNMGQAAQYKTLDQLKQAWSYFYNNLESDEMAEGIWQEKQTWEKDLRKRDAYSVGVLLARCKFLFKVF